MCQALSQKLGWVPRFHKNTGKAPFCCFVVEQWAHFLLPSVRTPEDKARRLRKEARQRSKYQSNSAILCPFLHSTTESSKSLHVPGYWFWDSISWKWQAIILESTAWKIWSHGLKLCEPEIFVKFYLLSGETCISKKITFLLQLH